MKQLNAGVGILGLQNVTFPDTDDGNNQKPQRHLTGLEAQPAYTVAPLEALQQLLSASQYVCQSGGSGLSLSSLKKAGQAFDMASRQFGDPEKMTYDGKHLRDIGYLLDALIEDHHENSECNSYNHGMLNGMLFVRQMLTGVDEPFGELNSCKLFKRDDDHDDKANQTRSST